NMPTAASVNFSFDHFGVTELDSTPPDAPTGLAASAEPSGVTLEWSASDPSSDVVGYRIYRGTELPVATAGPGLGGEAPLAAPSFTDDTTFIGETYHYAVVAVDAAGNKSTAAEADATVPGVSGEAIAKVNFQTADVEPPAGYTPDTGTAYSAEEGSGWITAADGSPLDNTGNARHRTGAGITDDLRLATIIHMDIPNATIEEGVWEYDLPNGSYNVVAAVGDGANLDSTHVVRAEGTVIIDGFVATSSRQF